MNTGRLLLPLAILVPAGVLLLLFGGELAPLGIWVMLAGQVSYIVLSALELRRADRRERDERERQERAGKR